LRIAISTRAGRSCGRGHMRRPLRFIPEIVGSSCLCVRAAEDTGLRTFESGRPSPPWSPCTRHAREPTGTAPSPATWRRRDRAGDGEGQRRRALRRHRLAASDCAGDGALSHPPGRSPIGRGRLRLSPRTVARRLGGAQRHAHDAEGRRDAFPFHRDGGCLFQRRANLLRPGWFSIPRDFM
jgi:hypothetical protein